MPDFETPPEPDHFEQACLEFKRALAHYRGKLGRDWLRQQDQGLLLDALDAGRPDTSHDPLSGVPSDKLPPEHRLLDSTIRELGDRYGVVSGTKGTAGIAFIVASGDDADELSAYIKRRK